MVVPLSVGLGSVEERLRVVKSCIRTLIVTVRPEQPVLAQPGADLHGLPGQQALHEAAVGQVGVVGALAADRLGLAVGHHRAVVLGAGELVEAVPVRLAQQAHHLVLGDGLEVGDGVDARAPQPLGGGRARRRG